MQGGEPKDHEVCAQDDRPRKGVEGFNSRLLTLDSRRIIVVHLDSAAQSS